MATRRFFDHTNPDGLDPTARGKRAGYECRKVRGNVIREGLGENLYQGSLYSRIRIEDGQRFYDWNTAEKIARQSVDGWMNSPGHRRNILEHEYGLTGLGVAIAADDSRLHHAAVLLERFLDGQVERAGSRFAPPVVDTEIRSRFLVSNTRRPPPAPGASESNRCSSGAPPPIVVVLRNAT